MQIFVPGNASRRDRGMGHPHVRHGVIAAGSISVRPATSPMRISLLPQPEQRSLPWSCPTELIESGRSSRGSSVSAPMVARRPHPGHSTTMLPIAFMRAILGGVRSGRNHPPGRVRPTGDSCQANGRSAGDVRDGKLRVVLEDLRVAFGDRQHPVTGLPLRCGGVRKRVGFRAELQTRWKNIQPFQ